MERVRTVREPAGDTYMAAGCEEESAGPEQFARLKSTRTTFVQVTGTVQVVGDTDRFQDDERD